jgi:hypothetical protein
MRTDFEICHIHPIQDCFHQFRRDFSEGDSNKHNSAYSGRDSADFGDNERTESQIMLFQPIQAILARFS